VELNQYVGQLMDMPDHKGTNQVRAKAESIRATIEVKARELQ
jgi:hypothetical protein